MKTYFLLQFKMLNRKIIDFGASLVVTYVIGPLVFILISNYLFEKTEYASYIYGLIVISFIVKLNNPIRNDFLKTIFNQNDYFKLRVIENIICSLPFILFLIYKQMLLFSLVLSLLVIILARFNFSITNNTTIPTPFGKKPFEFAVGFRKTFYVIAIAYLLTYVSIIEENFNIGIFSLLLIGIICFSYYLKLENKYFVWSFNMSSKDFLLSKLKICIVNYAFMSLPIVIALGIFFFNEIDVLSVFFILCSAYLLLIIFAKYSAYPNEMNMSQGILIAMSFLFPPMLLVLVPYFYSRAIKKLNIILE